MRETKIFHEYIQGRAFGVLDAVKDHVGIGKLVGQDSPYAWIVQNKATEPGAYVGER